MLGVPGLITNSGGGGGEGAEAGDTAPESGGASGGSSEVGGPSSMNPGSFSEEEKAGRMIEEGERSGGGGGGNRWPRQETLALLKIRSDMDIVFKDSSLKGPLWEEVSRKMAELGYHRSAKKCKEKFENVYKYHKRTKEGRASKADGKTYRFFDQLEALENNPAPPLSLPPPPRPPLATMGLSMPPGSTNNPPAGTTHVTVSSSPSVVNFSQNTNSQVIHANPISAAFQPSHQHPPQPLSQPQPSSNPPQFQNPIMSSSFVSYSTSSSTSSDEDIQRRRGKKRKWKDFFERLMKDVIDKQEELQKKFLEALEKRERDRMEREEACRAQEMARMNREHDLLVQERSIAAAKDAAVIAFLQKISEQQNLQIPISNVQLPVQPPAPPPPQTQQQVQQTPPPVSAAPPPRQQQQTPPPQPTQSQSLPQTQLASPIPISSVATPTPLSVAIAAPTATPTPMKVVANTPRTDNGGGGENFTPATSSSRWPKAEVQALINLRTSLDVKYQETGPKGPLWEEISASMAKLGYNRSAKRCKEKWENINKYFKKVKESNRKRPEDSKTCPYFHQLDAIYKERAKNESPFGTQGFTIRSADNPLTTTTPIMARPEQQWPLPADQQQPQQPQPTTPTHGGHAHEHDQENIDQNDDHDEDDDEDDGDDDDDEEGGGGYEIVTNKQPSSVTSTTS